MQLSRDDASDEPPLNPEINVTPFIDVMLVLLIIFMVTAPMMAQGMKVELPKSSTARPVEQTKPVVVSITASGELQVDGHTVTEPALAEAVRVALRGADRIIHVRGDGQTAYANVVTALDALTSAGLTRFVLAFERKKTK